MNPGPLDPPGIVRQTDDLAGLFAAANAEHEAGQRAERATLEHYRKAGEALLRAKAAAGHGNWLQVLKEQARFSSQRASEYMRLAAGWDKLPPGGSFALKEALRLISGEAGDGAAAAGGTAPDVSLRAAALQAAALQAPSPLLRLYLEWVREEDKIFPLVRDLTEEQRGFFERLFEGAVAETDAEIARLGAALDRPGATLQEVKEVRDRALAIQQDGAELKLRMERRMGILLSAQGAENAEAPASG
jgi:hypothetical protein